MPPRSTFPIFYVKRQVPLDAAGKVQQDDLRILRDAVPGADLYKRASAAPSATETNITARLTKGASWDVKDVDTSADGTRVVFAMRGPLAVKQDPKKPPSWRIYEYVIATDTLSPLIDPAADPDPLTVNDVSPHYLPDGRIVFSSTRQSQSQGILLDEGKPQFSAQDEDRQEPAFVLEVYNPTGLNSDGTKMHQISFNQSHDRDATVLSDGRVLWSRWDHAPGKDAMHLYSAHPDGTDLELYYGANSHLTGTNNTVVEFVQPRQMQDGRILALMRQYTDVDFGGELVIIDGEHYVENTQPLLADAGLPGPAQTPATSNDVVDHPRALPWRALHFRLPAAGWHQSHSGQLDAVPAAGQHPDAAGNRAVHANRSRRRQRADGPAALQRVDVRSAREHAHADHGAGRGRDGHRRGGGAAAGAAEHHPRQGGGGGPGPEPGRRRRRRHRYKECLRHRR